MASKAKYSHKRSECTQPKLQIPCCRYDSDSCQFKSQIIFILQLRLNVSDVFVGSLFLWNNQLEGFDSLAESWGQSWYCSSSELSFFFPENLEVDTNDQSTFQSSDSMT